MQQTIPVEFDADLIRRYDQRGPRYTSYPSAVQFSGHFTDSCFKSAIESSNALPIPANLSLYVHIPFCQQLCYYCACNKIITRDSGKNKAYLEAVLQEAKLQAVHLDQDRTVQQLHLGGGSPTFLNNEELQILMQGLADTFVFAEPGDREFSIEIDPRTVDAARIWTLAGMGFNRLSFGIQDFDARVQKAVNREQSFEEVRQLTSAAREAGFASVSVDLIYGLPHQSVKSFEKTLELTAALGPDRVSIYNYAHLPERFKAQRLIRAEDLPSPRDKLALWNLAVNHLVSRDYEYVGMDHFALSKDGLWQARENGRLQRNFQGYSTMKGLDILGLGVSAISSIGECYAQNDTVYSRYMSAIAGGILPIVRGLKKTMDDQLRAAVIDQLMCYGTIPMSEIGRRWKIDFASYFHEALMRLQPMMLDGLVEQEGQDLQVTPTGRMLLRSVAMCFDAYLQGDQQQRCSRII